MPSCTHAARFAMAALAAVAVHAAADERRRSPATRGPASSGARPGRERQRDRESRRASGVEPAVGPEQSSAASLARTSRAGANRGRPAVRGRTVPRVTELLGWLVLRDPRRHASRSRCTSSGGEGRRSEGVSRWLFVGQIAASSGFTIYSVLVGNAVFVVTNAILLASAVRASSSCCDTAVGRRRVRHSPAAIRANGVTRCGWRGAHGRCPPPPRAPRSG